jgi:hypothetical protein
MRVSLIFTAFFLFVNLLTGNSLFAQQKDSTTLSTVDSLMNPLNRADSAAFDLKNDRKDSILGSPSDTLFKKKSHAKDTLSRVLKDTIKKEQSFPVTKVDKKKKWSRPKKTMVLAMILPGAGQIYNEKYWKLPFLYVGAGVLTYYWYTNQVKYDEFRDQYIKENWNLVHNPSYQFVYHSKKPSGIYTSVNQLASERDTYRRYRDLSIAGAMALYAISILDAYVDAHLRTFDVSPDLSLSVDPLFYQNNATFVSGLSLNFQFKNNRSKYNQLLKRTF